MGNDQNSHLSLSNDTATQPPSAQPSRKSWQPRLGTRLSLKAKKWFPILAHAATLIISLAALYVISKQAQIYEGQRRVMTEQTDIIRKQSLIYEEQLKVMTEQTDIIRVAQRAYVGVAKITAYLPERFVVLAFENAGHVPANEVTITIWEMTNKNRSGSTTYRKEEQLFPGIPRMEVSVSLDDLQPEDISEIMAKKQKLYVLGTIEYDDGFGKQKLHFGYEYQPPPNEFWNVRSDIKLP